MKILSPAGNFESLKAAVFNGADEIYLGINEFNARNNIDGFTIESLKVAVDYAHVYGVKVCLAVNILFDDTEIEKALNLIVEAYNLGVDAFIIQDRGLIGLIRAHYPKIEIHASTQMGVHNLEGVQELEKIGIKRVVLARETPLNEIKRIRENSNIEIEYFVQGALCVSFSGNCYMSSYFLSASGNRGRCKQLCRLPFTLEKDGKKLKKGYLLSAKDFNMINRLKDLKESGVNVLKIEGRARRPYYVATATREYYNALNGKKANEDNLRLAFNRQYTEGYFNGNDRIISEYNNHIGISVGKVEKVNKGKNFNEVFFSSNKSLTAKSTFKFFMGEREVCTISAFDLRELSRGKYKLTTTNNVPINAEVRLIIDYLEEQKTLSVSTKKQVELNLSFKENQPARAEFSVFNEKYTVLGDVLEKSKSRPLSIEEITANFSKSEYFDCQNIKVELDDVFMLKQRLNAFRREVFDKMLVAFTERFRRDEKQIKIKKTKGESFKDFCFVHSIEGEFLATNVIYSPEEYSIINVQKFIDKCSKLGKIAYLDTPNFALSKDVELLEQIVEKTGVGIVANNYYALNLSDNLIIGAGLNVYNNYSAEYFGYPVITAESDLFEKTKMPYMTLRHCPIKTHVGGNCKNCKYSNGYSLISDDGRKMKIVRKKLSTCTFYLVD